MSSLKYELVILDRDGVLNVRNKSGYVLDMKDLVLAPDLSQLSRLSRSNLSLVVATNQQCVGLGLITTEKAIMISQIPLMQAGIVSPNVFLCPHLKSDDCNCRKPRAGLIEQALLQTKVSAGRVVMIGDSESDLRAAENARIDFLGVCWNGECLGIVCCHTLSGAVDRILNSFADGV